MTIKRTRRPDRRKGGTASPPVMGSFALFELEEEQVLNPYELANVKASSNIVAFANSTVDPGNQTRVEVTGHSFVNGDRVRIKFSESPDQNGDWIISDVSGNFFDIPTAWSGTNGVVGSSPASNAALVTDQADLVKNNNQWSWDGSVFSFLPNDEFQYENGAVQTFLVGEHGLIINLNEYTNRSTAATWEISAIGLFIGAGTATPDTIIEVAHKMNGPWTQIATDDNSGFNVVRTIDSFDIDPVRGKYLRVRNDEVTVFPMNVAVVAAKTDVTAPDPSATLTPVVPSVPSTLPEIVGMDIFADDPFSHIGFLKTGRMYSQAMHHFSDATGKAAFETASIGNLDNLLSALSAAGMEIWFNIKDNTDWHYNSGLGAWSGGNKETWWADPTIAPPNRTSAVYYDVPSSWFEEIVHRYGNNASSTYTPNLAAGETEKIGLGYITGVVYNNEQILQVWEGGGVGGTGDYVLARVPEYMTGLKDMYDKVKAIDSTILVAAFGMAFWSPGKWMEVWAYCHENLGGVIPFDMGTEHIYPNTGLDQIGAVNNDDRGVSPERYGLYDILIEHSDLYHGLFPGKHLSLFEIGWDTAPTLSPMRAPAIINSDVETTQASWHVRQALWVVATQRYRNDMPYQSRDVNPPTNERFKKSGFGGDTPEYLRKASWYHWYLFLTTMDGWSFDSIVTNNGDAGLNVHKYTKGSQEMLIAWSGTEDDSTLSSQAITLNATHTRAKVVRYSNSRKIGLIHAEPIVSNDVTLDITETAIHIISDAVALAAPGVPTGLRTTAVGQTTIDLTWEPADDWQEDYRLEQSAAGAGSWSLVATLSNGTNTQQVTGLTANTKYDFRVRAENATGNSAYSTTLEARTQSDATATATHKIDVKGTSSETTPGGYTAMTGNPALNMTVTNIDSTTIDCTVSGFTLDQDEGYQGGDQTIPDAVRASIVKATTGNPTIVFSQLPDDEIFDVEIYTSRAFTSDECELLAEWDDDTDYNDRSKGLLNIGDDPVKLISLEKDVSDEINITLDFGADSDEINICAIHLIRYPTANTLADLDSYFDHAAIAEEGLDDAGTPATVTDGANFDQWTDRIGTVFDLSYTGASNQRTGIGVPKYWEESFGNCVHTFNVNDVRWDRATFTSIPQPFTVMFVYMPLRAAANESLFKSGGNAINWKDENFANMAYDMGTGTNGKTAFVPDYNKIHYVILKFDSGSESIIIDGTERYSSGTIGTAGINDIRIGVNTNMMNALHFGYWLKEGALTGTEETEIDGIIKNIFSIDTAISDFDSTDSLTAEWDATNKYWYLSDDGGTSEWSPPASTTYRWITAGTAGSPAFGSEVFITESTHSTGSPGDATGTRLTRSDYDLLFPNDDGTDNVWVLCEVQLNALSFPVETRFKRDNIA